MFNVTGSEIFILLVLALVVVGPERLPDVIRKFGKTYGELKKMSTGFQTELRDALDEPMREMRATADEIRRTIEEPINETVKSGNDAMKAGLSDSSPATDQPAPRKPFVSTVISGPQATPPPPEVEAELDGSPEPEAAPIVRPTSPFDTARSSASPRSAAAIAATELHARARNNRVAASETVGFAPPSGESVVSPVLDAPAGLPLPAPLPPPGGGSSMPRHLLAPSPSLPPPSPTQAADPSTAPEAPAE